MRLVCDPNPFCFGSVSTLRTVLDQLPEAAPVVLASGATLDLCDGLQVAECDVRSPASVSRHDALLRSADFYLAVSNNTNIPRVLELGVPLAFIDILYFMKRRRTAAMQGAAAYVVENYPGVAERLATLRPERLHVVGPLTPSLREQERVHPLLVNIGGASSPDLRPGQNTDYPARVVELASRLSQDRSLGALPVAMGSEAADSAPTLRYAGPRTFRREDFLGQLAASEVLLTAPGLNAVLEACRGGVPLAWLPPQNLTQVAHLDVYVNAGLAPRGLELDVWVPGFEVDPGCPETQGTATVLAALAQMDDRVWGRVADHVQGQLDGLDAPAQVERQRRWFAGLGSQGPEQVAQIIRGLC